MCTILNVVFLLINKTQVIERFTKGHLWWKLRLIVLKRNASVKYWMEQCYTYTEIKHFVEYKKIGILKSYLVIPAHITSNSSVSPMIVPQIFVHWPEHLIRLKERRPIFWQKPMRVIDISRYLETATCVISYEYYRLRTIVGWLLQTPTRYLVYDLSKNDNSIQILMDSIQVNSNQM